MKIMYTLLIIPSVLTAVEPDTRIVKALDDTMRRHHREWEILNKKNKVYSHIRSATAVALTLSVIASRKVIDQYLVPPPKKSIALMDSLLGLIVNNATSLISYLGLGVTALIIYSRINNLLHAQCRVKEARLKESQEDELKRMGDMIDDYERKMNDRYEVQKKEMTEWQKKIQGIEQDWYDKLDTFVRLAKSDFKKLISEFNTNREKLMTEIRNTVKIDTKGFEEKLAAFQSMVESAVSQRRDMFLKIQQDWDDIRAHIKQLESSNIHVKDSIQPISENMARIMDQLENLLRRMEQIEQQRNPYAQLQPGYRHEPHRV